LLLDGVVFDFGEQDLGGGDGVTGVQERPGGIGPADLVVGKLGVAFGGGGAHAAVQAQHFAQARHRARQDRLGHDRQRGAELESDVDGVGAGLRVFRARVPRLGVVEVLVAAPREGHRLEDCLAHPVVFVGVADFFRRLRQGVERGAVFFGGRAERGDAPVEVVLAKRECAVDEVAQHVGQLAIDAVLEAPPREVRVFRLRQRRRQRVAQEVGRVLAVGEVVEELVQPHRPAATGRELAALDVEKLVGRHVLRQDVLAVRLEHGRKHDAVKDDVVLPDEVDEARVLAFLALFPVVFPALGAVLRVGPFFRGADVADGRVEPDVEHLALGIRHSVRFGYVGRDGDAPGQVPRNGALAQALVEPAPHLAAHVGLPIVGDVVQPVFEVRLQAVERQVEVRRLALGRGRVGQRAARVDQLAGAEVRTAVFALVAVGLVVAADRTGAAHEAIRQEELGLGIVELRLGAEREGALLGELAKKALRRLAVRGGGGAPVVVEAHPEAGEALLDLRVILVHDGLRVAPGAQGAQVDRDAHLVGAADEEHVAALQALVAAEKVRRQVRPRQVADVNRPVGVGKRGGDEQALVALFTAVVSGHGRKICRRAANKRRVGWIKV